MQALFNCFAVNNHHIVLFAAIIIMPTNKVRIHVGSDPLGTPAIKLQEISWVCVKPRSQERQRPVAQKRLIDFGPVSTTSEVHKLSPGPKNGVAPMKEFQILRNIL